MIRVVITTMTSLSTKSPVATSPSGKLFGAKLFRGLAAVIRAVVIGAMVIGAIVIGGSSPAYACSSEARFPLSIPDLQGADPSAPLAALQDDYQEWLGAK